jgi:hypothetical protein
MSEFNYKKYLKEGRLLKEGKAANFKIGDKIIYNFNGKQTSGEVLDHFGDGIFIGLDRSISFKDPESVGRANPMGYNTDLSVDMFELFDGEENPYGSIDNVELAENQTLKEKLSPEQQKILNSLRDELKTSLDPDATRFSRNADDIRDNIRQEFGDTIANQIEDGEYEMNFPRDKGVPFTQRPDKLSQKEKSGGNRYRVTKSGKMNKQDVNRMKNQYKKGY